MFHRVIHTFHRLRPMALDKKTEADSHKYMAVEPDHLVHVIFSYCLSHERTIIMVVYRNAGYGDSPSVHNHDTPAG